MTLRRTAATGLAAAVLLCDRSRLFAEGAKPAPEILFQSPIACVACHETRAPAPLGSSGS